MSSRLRPPQRPVLQRAATRLRRILRALRPDRFAGHWPGSARRSPIGERREPVGL